MLYCFKNVWHFLKLCEFMTSIMYVVAVQFFIIFFSISLYIFYSFSYAILLVSKTSRHPASVISARKLMSGRLSRHCVPLLASPQLRYFANPHRGYAMIVGRILRGALKVRYLLLGGTVGGGYALQKVNRLYIFLWTGLFFLAALLK